MQQKKPLLGRIVRGALYTAGAIIALRFAAPYIEKYFAGVTFERITKAFGAARPGGNLGTSPAPALRPSPRTVDPSLTI